MNDDIFGVASFFIIIITVVFCIGYGMASSGVIKLKENKWSCTASIIVDGVAVCSEYKLKESK